MADAFPCPDCAAPLPLDPAVAGRPIRCPNCGEIVPPARGAARSFLPPARPEHTSPDSVHEAGRLQDGRSAPWSGTGERLDPDTLDEAIAAFRERRERGLGLADQPEGPADWRKVCAGFDLIWWTAVATTVLGLLTGLLTAWANGTAALELLVLLDLLRLAAGYFAAVGMFRVAAVPSEAGRTPAVVAAWAGMAALMGEIWLSAIVWSSLTGGTPRPRDPPSQLVVLILILGLVAGLSRFAFLYRFARHHGHDGLALSALVVPVGVAGVIVALLRLGYDPRWPFPGRVSVPAALVLLLGLGLAIAYLLILWKARAVARSRV